MLLDGLRSEGVYISVLHSPFRLKYPSFPQYAGHVYLSGRCCLHVLLLLFDLALSWMKLLGVS